MMSRGPSHRRVSWQDLLEWSHESTGGAVYDEENLTWFSARFQEESLRGSFEGHFFGSGMFVILADLYVDRDLEITAEQTEPMAGFGMATEGFCVRRLSDRRGRSLELPVAAGRNVAGAYDAVKTSVTFTGGRTHKLVNLRMRKARVPELLEEWETHLSQPLRQMLSPTCHTSIALDTTLSPALHRLAGEMLHCPYTGVARRLFMEGKALEVLACQIDGFSERDSEKRVRPGTADVERLHQARTILETEFASPPTLMALAHRVGLNDFKLKRGFRDLFGTTVFGYVRQLRMANARHLLHNTRLSVTDVALSVGYNSFGHFAEAFKKSFGVLPSVYRKKLPRLY
jgi:AraC-like DNA-binding protein